MRGNPYTRLLHSLAHRHGMTDEQYRDMLKDRYGVSSSLQLSPLQARLLCSDLSSTLPRTEPKKARKERFSELAGRDSNYATPRQLRMLEAAFVHRSRMDTLERKREAFFSFVHNRFGIAGISWIEQQDVGKIFKAIVSLSNKQPASEKEASHG